ncbi:hypothetical protein OJF2_32690 [Aquisphaera giovannonii]|uniref:Lipoprotein n=1 Tax=Aquisphaera giovannonii TaxID=406548 RepID=A0A5B9W393_9BACT|nr:hypothetical protein [Aquisphaera giovannonii]QEH34727.1 hypothetical protein OJF2_32690 [Aquisphaera giovannonii]
MRLDRLARRCLVPLLAAPLLILSGCGGDDMSHLKALSTYTPDNVGSELLIRYKAAKQRATPRGAEKKSKGQGIVVDGDKKPGPDAKPGVSTAHDASAATKGQSIQDLIENIAKKAKLVEGTPQPEVYSRISSAIDADKELSPADKEDLKASLKQAMGV